MDLGVYKLDERQAILDFTLTAAHDEVAKRYEASLVNRKSDFNNIFLDKIAELGSSCLDVGMAYGAQYFALKAIHPTVQYAGAEISPDFIAKFLGRFKDGEFIPTVYNLTDYQNMFDIQSSSFDVVTARSVLRHYTPEHGFKIIDEMLRIAKKAVIVKFATPIEFPDDIYTEAFGPWVGKGYYIEWSKPKWDAYCKDKKMVDSGSPLVHIFLK